MSEQDPAPAEHNSKESALTQQQTKMLTIMYALFGAGIIYEGGKEADDPQPDNAKPCGA